MDKTGGKVKSEAGMGVKRSEIVAPKEEPREFIFDDTFVLFLQECGKNLPYLSLKVSDISNIQENK